MVSSVSRSVVYILSIFILIENQVLCATWSVRWEHKNFDCKDSSKVFGVCPLELHMNEKATVNVTISNLDGPKNQTIRLVSDSEVLNVPLDIQVHNVGGKEYRGWFVCDAQFIGKAIVHIEISTGSTVEPSDSVLPVVITRAQRVIDTVFVASVATLVSILYINFGAALDLKKVKGVLRRPIGPIIAFGCHFLLLPLVS